MIFSAEQLFSDDQALAATGASTNYIDLGATGTPVNGAGPLVRDIGPGNGVPILIQSTADATGTAPTCSAAIQVDDNTSFSSATTIATVSIGTSAGDKSPIVVVPNTANERYMRINYTLGGTTPAFVITAGIVAGVQTNT